MQRFGKPGLFFGNLFDLLGICPIGTQMALWHGIEGTGIEITVQAKLLGATILGSELTNLDHMFHRIFSHFAINRPFATRHTYQAGSTHKDFVPSRNRLCLP